MCYQDKEDDDNDDNDDAAPVYYLLYYLNRLNPLNNWHVFQAAKAAKAAKKKNTRQKKSSKRVRVLDDDDDNDDDNKNDDVTTVAIFCDQSCLHALFCIVVSKHKRRECKSRNIAWWRKQGIVRGTVTSSILRVCWIFFLVLFEGHLERNGIQLRTGYCRFVLGAFSMLFNLLCWIVNYRFQTPGWVV